MTVGVRTIKYMMIVKSNEIMNDSAETCPHSKRIVIN
jgi:hypothetical protein